MSNLRQLVIRWQLGWGVARGVPGADDLGDGLRVWCQQPSRDVEIIALHADDDPPSVGRLADRLRREDSVAWLTVPTREPAKVADALLAARLVVAKGAEQLMTIQLGDHPRHEVPAPYRLDIQTRASVIFASIYHDSGKLAASGVMGVAGADAIADRIETAPAHRRQGLAKAIMGALAHAAVERGAQHGVLVASEEGQHLYAALGWRGAADVLIAVIPDSDGAADSAQ
jgi:GNAT superfamily N-acetyltransferase